MTSKTLDEPVTAEVLEKLRILSEARSQICNQYMDLDNEKVKLQVAVKRIDAESSKLFEKELIDRGISPDTHATIEPATGKITVTPPAEAKS